MCKNPEEQRYESNHQARHASRVKLSKCKISANVFLSDASFKNENVENLSEETLTLHL